MVNFIVEFGKMAWLIPVFIWLTVMVLWLHLIRRNAMLEITKGKCVSYWKLRLVGMGVIRTLYSKIFIENYDLGQLKKYQREWFYKLVLSDDGMTKVFCHQNNFILNRRVCREFLGTTGVQNNFRNCIEMMSSNPQVWTSLELMQYASMFRWNTQNIYQTISYVNLLQYRNMVNLELALKWFKFKNQKEFRLFYDNMVPIALDVSTYLSKNKSFRPEWLTDRSIPSSKEEVTQQLPVGSVKITDEIYSIGKELWIFKDGNYVKDNG